MADSTHCHPAPAEALPGVPEAWLRPDWPAPAHVQALCTTRAGGMSTGAYASMNLGDHVGDAPQAVAANRARLAAALRGPGGAVRPVFLNQVHGAAVVQLGPGTPDRTAADGAWTTEKGVACTVLVADCLPVLLAAPDGRAVAAAHAGWRGLAGGVVEAALRAVCAAAHCEPGAVHCWLGACIGPRRFEVGADVLAAFGGDPAASDPLRFAPRGAADGTPRKWLANLPQLARDRLHAAGARHVAGTTCCTFEDRSRFFSFRRDGVTGRMAAAIWIKR